MSTPDQNDPLRGASFETIQQYSNLLLGAAELRDTLSAQVPVATDERYVVANPLTTANIPLPGPLEEFARYDGARLLSVAFQSISKYTPEAPLVTSYIEFEFDDEDHDAIIQMIDDAPQLLYRNRDAEAISLNPTDVSATLSRMAFPTTDPLLTDFRNMEDPRKVAELCDVLKNTPFVTSSSDKTYEIDERYQVVVQTSGDKIISCDITELRKDKPYPVAISIEFNYFSNASALYKITESGSKELIADEGDLEHFVEIIEEIKAKLQPEISDINLEEL